MSARAMPGRPAMRKNGTTSTKEEAEAKAPQATHVPLRRLARHMEGFEKMRGAHLFFFLACIATYRNFYRFDWVYSAETYRLYQAATGDLPGVFHSES